MNELLKLSALDLHKKVQTKEVSPSEVLEAHITRIEQVNPALNAMVEDDFVRARKLAHEQTETLAKNNSDLPPLFGVPFTVKEMFSYQGMKRTGGSIHHKNDVMDWDATVVARMKKAGGIPMGTTNVPELGFWFECFNPVYGRTSNPYDLGRTCGGSSGGEGALIGAGASPLGLGSDIGGSIRMPASFCGVFGHKPSRYLLPLTGHFPFEQNDFRTLLLDQKYPYTSMGPMTRKAVDLAPMMKILMGSDDIDQHTLKNPTMEELSQEWKGRKVLICPNPVFHRARGTDDEMVQVVKNCGKLFEELGAHVEELDPRFFVRSAELWFAAVKNSKNRNLYETLMGPTQHLSIGKEILQLTFGKGNYTLPNLLVSLAEIFDTRKKDFTEEMQALAKMKSDLDEKLGADGILILPPHPRVAPKHRAPLWSPFDFIYTAIFTTLGHPATSVPMGLNEDGIPLGVQVVGPYMKDHLTLACAEFLETTFGGWQPPKNL
ncbi:amidase [Bdellovibrio bacteriovorus]|uniref:Putative amidase n=1 Tax=Bdellovibrio bacteriovorus (strain ATCC 15356 / DSM 50701 / NCIMB 9529 / HD100) TaxID=264462 RepID=Q6MJR1_BDEBA|nr:amidase [Bdellovibrio bacteriovorus]CAE80499.1 putative amidase [Bdellovibrio bacteriovorus HD100]